MKITQSQLRETIKEEVSKLLKENEEFMAQMEELLARLAADLEALGVDERRIGIAVNSVETNIYAARGDIFGSPFTDKRSGLVGMHRGKI